MNTTNAVDTNTATAKPLLAKPGTTQTAEDGAVLPTIQQASGETHSAVADAVTEKFDPEKFWKEFEEQLGWIDKENDFNTVEESLIPELQKSLMPAMEAGVDHRDLRSFTLKFFKFNQLARNQVLTAISTAAITACLKFELIRDPSVYADFTVKLLEIEIHRFTANSGAGASDTAQRIHDELERVIEAKNTNMDPVIITKIAQIVFPDYASVIPIAVMHSLSKMAKRPAK